jgi:hypothetical protein
VGLFRKRDETYNEQMLREAGLDRVVFKDPTPLPDDPPPLDTGKIPVAYFGGLFPHGVQIDVDSGTMPWDAATTATAPGIAGDRVSFITLPNGDLIVEDEEGNGDLSPLADAIEGHLSPPYQAKGTRQDGDLWGVGAKRIEVAEFAFPDADALELSEKDGETELRVDGEPSDGAVPMELQRLGERAGADFCVEAKRIDGDSWEVKVSPL